MSESPQEPSSDGLPNGQSQNWQAAVDAIPTATVRVDGDGYIQYTNEQASAQFGIEPGTAVLDAFSDLTTLDGAAVTTAEHPLSRVINEPIDGDRYRLKSPDGTDRVVAFEGQPIDADGAVASIRDVTAAVDRCAERDRLTELLAQSPDNTFVLDTDGIVTYQSPSPDDGLDFEPRDLVGESPTHYIHPADRERVCADFERLLDREPGDVITTEFRLRDATDSYHWFENRAINYLDTEPINGVLVVARSIHQRKQTEARLGTSTAMLEELQTTTQRLLRTTNPTEAATIALSGIEEGFEFDIAGIWLADDDRRRLEPVAISDRGQEVVDTQPVYTAETDSISWQVFKAGTPKRIDDLTTQQNCHNAETPLRSELIVPIGTYGLLNIGSTDPDAFTDDDLRRVRVWSSTVESAFARLEQVRHLRDREAALERERDRLDDFAGVISHDLRNPLHIAEGHLSLAQVNCDCDCDHLEPIDTALSRMNDIIEDTLTLAREGETVDTFEPVALPHLIESCVAVTEATPATVEIDADCSLMGDPDRLAHVIENLCQNAVDHGGEDVTITVGILEEGFYVADDGPGIPPDKRKTVFESGYTTAEEGTGLGLRIVERIVEAHGWEIEITDSASGGTRFEISGVTFAEDNQCSTPQ
jgi:PAS domain S-box-containing protein